MVLDADGTNVVQLADLVATIDDIGDVVITAAASGQMLRFNGSSWVNEDSPYDVGMFIPGTQGSGRALMAQVVLTRAVSFADDFVGAPPYAGVSATAATLLDVHKNGSSIGTITFGSGASAGTFATTGGGAETFAAGDRCQSASKLDPRLEWAPRAGQVGPGELTGCGLSEERPWQDSIDPTASRSSVRSSRNFSPASPCTGWRSGTTCPPPDPLWVGKAEAGAFDEDPGPPT